VYRIYQAIKNRMSDFLMAQANLTVSCSAGQNYIDVDDATNFTTEAINNSFPTVILMDNSTSGKKTSTGYKGAELIDVEKVETNRIYFQTSTSRAWELGSSAVVRRAPGGVPFRNVFIGDRRVIKAFPALCVIPINKTIEWHTLSGTMDKVNVDFLVYVRDTDTEEAEIELLKVCDAIEWILMSNLHIQPYGYNKDREKASVSKVNTIDYGIVNKGSEFLKAARLSWSADLYFWRGYLTRQGIVEGPLT